MKLTVILILMWTSFDLYGGVSLEYARSSEKVTTSDGDHYSQPRLYAENKKGFGAFSLDLAGYYPSGGMEFGYGEFIFRGIGLHLRNLSIGTMWGYKYFGPKLVINEFDFSINRGIVGGYITYQDSYLYGDFSVGSYNPVNSHSSKIDSFPISVSAFPYKKIALKLGIDLLLVVEGEFGVLQGLKLYYGIPNYSYEETEKTINYMKGTVKFPVGQGFAFGKIYSHTAEDASEIHKYLGTSVSFEILNGGSLGYEFSF